MKDYNASIRRAIQLNVELEGALRVAAERGSAEAMDTARAKFAELSQHFDELSSYMNPGEGTPLTEAKEDEAVGAEEAPDPVIPDAMADAPADPVIVESDTQAEEVNLEQPETKPEAKPEEAAPAASAAPAAAANDLRKAFTLNDKFMFRRELFGGSDADFTDTIELLSSMHSLDEVEEYVYDDLQWDPKAPAVVDFMAIVAAHFPHK